MELIANGRGASMLVLLAGGIGLLAVFYPESVLGITLAVFWGAVLLLILYRGWWGTLPEMWLKKVALVGLLVRVPASLLHLAVGYWIFGGQLDFPGFFASSMSLGRDLLSGGSGFFDLRYSHPGDLSAAVVSRLSALGYFLVGPSLPAAFLLSGLIGFLGSFLFVRAFQTQFPAGRSARFAALTLFCFPSLVFWTTLLGKDSLVFFFLGWATYALAQLMRKVRLRYVVALSVSTVIVTPIRLPIGAALAAGMGVSLFLSLSLRLPRKGAQAFLGPVGAVCLGLVVIGAMLLFVVIPLEEYVKGYSSDETLVGRLVDVALYKHVGLSTDPTAGGSSLDPSVGERTVLGILRYLPMGMFTVLFRPFVFEAHNLVALIAALDSGLLLALVIWRWKYLLAASRCVFTQPFVSFCMAMFLLLTVVLSFETNFGAIVRHRTMVLPFLFLLLAVPRGTESPGGSRSLA